MARKPRLQFLLAQNFLRSTNLVRSLVDESNIGAADMVYEIGPGNGIITAELARVAYKIIAIEKDAALVKHLKHQFRDIGNVEIIENDFLQFCIAAKAYKIFANIPFNITAEIVRKILYTPPTPSDAYLIMQKEAGEKFSGMPRETQFSILAKPYWHFQIFRNLRRKDFVPMPNVEVMLLHIKKRPTPLIQEEDMKQYNCFVRYGFGRWRRNLKLIFKTIFSYEQWKRLSKDLNFPLDATPGELTFEQWLGLFDCFKRRVPRIKQVNVLEAHRLGHHATRCSRNASS